MISNELKPMLVCRLCKRQVPLINPPVPMMIFVPIYISPTGVWTGEIYCERCFKLAERREFDAERDAYNAAMEDQMGD